MHQSMAQKVRCCGPAPPLQRPAHSPRGIRAEAGRPWPRHSSPRKGLSMASRHEAPWPSRLHGEARSSASRPPRPQVGTSGIRDGVLGPAAPQAGAPLLPRAPLLRPGQSVGAHGSKPPRVSSMDRPLGGAIQSGLDAPQACEPSPPRALQAPGRPVCSPGTGLPGKSSRQALSSRPGLPAAALDPRCCGSEAARGSAEGVPGPPCPEHSGPW